MSKPYLPRWAARLGQRIDFLRSAEQRQFLKLVGPIFDRRWYRDVYDDVRRARVDPLSHFLSKGIAEGRDPGPTFNTSWYKATYPGVGEGEQNAVLHFVRQGAAELRDPHPLFSTRFYTESHPDVQSSGVNPLIHYLTRGASLGYDPNPLFCTQWYTAKNPEVTRTHVNPLVHFIQFSASELTDPHPLFSTEFYMETYGDKLLCANPLADFLSNGRERARDPNPIFSTAWYLATYPDVAASGINPLVHYIRMGARSGYDPSPIFSTNWYRAAYPDVADRNPLEHYMTLGIAERRRGSPNFDPVFYMAQTGLETVTGAYHHYVQEGCSKHLLRTIADARLDVLPNSVLGSVSVTENTKIVVGVVLYKNTQEQIERIFSSAIHAISQCGDAVEGEVYLIDNGGSGDTFVTPPGSHFFASDGNRGFGAGHNFLMKAAFAAGANVYLGVNPDGAFHPDAIARLLMMNTEKLGRAMIEAQQFPEEHAKYYDPETLRTRWLSGACFLLPRTIFEATGGFDERIFLYCEDVDLSWTAQRHGFETLHCPAALFYHDVSDRGDDDMWRYREMLASGRYLGHKWNCPEFKKSCEMELLKLADVAVAPEFTSLEDVPVLQGCDHSDDFRHRFSFSPIRPAVSVRTPAT